MDRPRVPFSLIATFYLLSGALGLVYEVAFSKYLGYSFGTTAAASSAVLVAFMGGIATGSYLIARIERRIERPFLVYGAVEIAIGLFCLVAPALFKLVGKAYLSAASHTHSLVALSALRGSLAILIVAVPAIGMGSTLPLLARFIHGMLGTDESHDARMKLVALYGINTLGGALGSLASAYVLIPTLGVSLAMRCSALVSITIGAISLSIGRKLRILLSQSTDEALLVEADRTDSASWISRDPIVLAAASGLLVFCSEVIFTHLLALVIGTSAYAFGLMLAIFLLCLALGTPLANYVERRLRQGALPISLTATGLALVLSLPIWDRLPGVFLALGPHVRSWAGRETVRGLAALAALAVPVTCMGSTFPLVLRAARRGAAASDVGRITAANTIGSIVGSLLAGFVILERLGSYRSILFVAAGYAGAGLFAARREVGQPRRRALWLVGATAALGLLVPSWNLARLTSGTNVYFAKPVVDNGILEMIQEDIHGGVTTIVRDPVTNERTLLTNGKFQGNDSKELQQNRGFAYLPSFFAGSTDRALVIGMGTAVTTGALATFPYDRIDVAELAPAIIKASKTTFAEVNGHALDDWRVHVLVEDGRNVLYLRKTTYDVITIELTSVWFAGAANLYNREFYEIAKERLTSGGVLQQWIQFHHTNRTIVASILHTISVVFKHVALFADGHQGHILASQEPLRANYGRISDYAYKHNIPEEELMEYVKGIVLDTDAIDEFVKDTAKAQESKIDDFISTDDNTALEYATPKGNVPTADDIPTTLAYLLEYKPKGVFKDTLEM